MVRSADGEVQVTPVSKAGRSMSVAHRPTGLSGHHPRLDHGVAFSRGLVTIVLLSALKLSTSTLAEP